jgi:dipeptidase E
MKLYLASFGIQPHLSEEFLKLVGKLAQDIKFAYITNAADPYPPGKRGWVEDVRKQLTDLGIRPKTVDLRNYSGPKILKADLSKFDVIWCGGGNTWYLRYVMQTSGFDQVIQELLEKGTIYGGDSAGAIMATPTLKFVEILDNPADAPEQIEEGLGLVDFCIVPHWDYKPYKEQLTKMRDGLKDEGYEVITLTDRQAIIAYGKGIQVV